MEYLSEKNWIEKSKTLIYAEWSKFDIHELQIFETYLSRINPRDPESSCVQFTKKEYAEMMGYASHKSLKTRVLDRWVKNFMTKQISIVYEGGVRHFNLFSDADVHKDPETGEIVIDLDCNVKLKPVFFNIAEQGYIAYRRQYTIDFKSEYTLKLYCLLKDHAWGNYEWTVDLKELRGILGATEPLYDKFAEFNRRILKKAEDEINASSDIIFTYEKITKGRLTRAVKFKIKSKEEVKDSDVIPGQMSLDDYKSELPSITDQEVRDKEIEFFREPFKDINPNWSITDDQVEHIAAMIRESLPYKLTDTKASMDIAVYDKLHSILLHAKAEGAKTIYGWLEFMFTNTDLLDRY